MIHWSVYHPKAGSETVAVIEWELEYWVIRKSGKQNKTTWGSVVTESWPWSPGRKEEAFPKKGKNGEQIIVGGFNLSVCLLAPSTSLIQGRDSHYAAVLGWVLCRPIIYTVSAMTSTETHTQIWWLQQCNLLNENVTDTFVLKRFTLRSEDWRINSFVTWSRVRATNSSVCSGHSWLKYHVLSASFIPDKAGELVILPADLPQWFVKPIQSSNPFSLMLINARQCCFHELGLKGENNDGGDTGCGGQSAGLGIGRSANKHVCDIGKNLSSFSRLFFPKRKEFIWCFISILPTPPFYCSFLWI